MRYSRKPHSKASAYCWPAVRRVATTIGVVLALTACTTYYVHPEKKSNRDFNRDKQDCQRIAEKEALRKGTRVCDEVDRCLVTMKGWRRD